MMGVLSCLDGPETSGVHCPAISVHEFFDRTRYFADFLSMIESNEAIVLYSDERGSDGRPLVTRGLAPVLTLPNNVFVMGTVNVDETTYMFSPKVLDRANVIEFRVAKKDMGMFVRASKPVDLRHTDGNGSRFASEFLDFCGRSLNVPEEFTERYQAEMQLFFQLLQEHNAEFGYRVANESARFLGIYKLLGDGKIWHDRDWLPSDPQGRDVFNYAFDSIIVQKLLPKLHGSRAKLGPLLKNLYALCIEPPSDTPRNLEEALEKAAQSAKSSDVKNEPSADIPIQSRYPISAEKIGRMWRLLRDNGFTSFAEA